MVRTRKSPAIIRLPISLTATSFALFVVSSRFKVQGSKLSKHVTGFGIDSHCLSAYNGDRERRTDCVIKCGQLSYFSNRLLCMRFRMRQYE